MHIRFFNTCNGRSELEVIGGQKDWMSKWEIYTQWSCVTSLSLSPEFDFPLSPLSNGSLTVSRSLNIASSEGKGQRHRFACSVSRLLFSLIMWAVNYTASCDTGEVRECESSVLLALETQVNAFFVSRCRDGRDGESLTGQWSTRPSGSLSQHVRLIKRKEKRKKNTALHLH